MYLSILNQKEKELFLELAYNLASADGDYSSKENALINGYCQEMQIEFEVKMMTRSLDYIISTIKKESFIIFKKIFVFELIGLAMVDKNYDESERDLIGRLENEFGMEANFASECEKILNEYISFQEKINQLVLM